MTGFVAKSECFMAVLTILAYPDERLRDQALPVTQVIDNTRIFIRDLFETMYHDNGVGLAATQVGMSQRIFVMDFKEDGLPPLCFINPEIIAASGFQTLEEGCLSFPGLRAKVQRAHQLTVQALNEQGESFTLTLENIQAVCVQHELDHLNGILFIDHLSPLKRERALKQLQKQRRTESA
jgi:peptide deformylase